MNDETTKPTRPVDQAAHVVKQWDADDQRYFMNWVCGYNPGAVLKFELTRRRLPDAAVERALGREPRKGAHFPVGGGQ